MFWSVTLSLLEGLREVVKLFALTLVFSLPLGLAVTGPLSPYLSVRDLAWTLIRSGQCSGKAVVIRAPQLTAAQAKTKGPGASGSTGNSGNSNQTAAVAQSAAANTGGSSKRPWWMRLFF